MYYTWLTGSNTGTAILRLCATFCVITTVVVLKWTKLKVSGFEPVKNPYKQITSNEDKIDKNATRPGSGFVN